MATFKDSKGRTWKLAITFPLLRTLRDDGVIDLLASRNPYEAMPAFLDSDPIVQIDAIGEAVRLYPEEQEQNYDPYDFAAALDQDSVIEGCYAFCDAMADFSPSLSDSIKKILTECRSESEIRRAKATELIQTRLEGLIADLKARGNLPTGSEDSQESTSAEATAG